MSRESRVSAIVPTLNETVRVARCIDRLLAGGVDEVVVVDGGSSDGTRERAVTLADKVVEAGGGLFAQLNRGAREASGDVLLFHYADVLFCERGAAEIREVLEDRRVVGGAFRLGFDSPRASYRFVACAANLRNRLGFGPFGDQSIFVRLETFCEIGGFDPRAYLADYDLVRRLRRAGRFRILGGRVRTSVRRWEQSGFWATLLSHWRLSAAYFLSRGPSGGKRASEVEAIRRVR